MKITMWAINYSPELTGIAPYNAEFCEYFAERGHDIHVVTTFPYYPEWKKRDEDKRKVYQISRINKVFVHRCWHFVPERVTSLARILHEFSYLTISMMVMIFLRRPDFYFVVSPPLPLGFTAWIISRLRGRPFVFHVQDLQPDAAVTLGMLGNSTLIDFLYRLERQSYKKAGLVSGITTDMLRAFKNKGVPPFKRMWVPNWISGTSHATPRPPKGRFRQRHGIASEVMTVTYSGNLGMKQGLGIIAETALILKERDLEKNILFIVAGEGAAREEIRSEISKHKLHNIYLLPLQPIEQFYEMLEDADITLVTQKSGSGRAFFPSKCLTLMARSRPVLGICDQDSPLTEAIEQSGAGWVIPPDQPRQLAEFLHQRFQQDPSEREEKGERAFRWISQFTRESVLSELEKSLEAWLKAEKIY